MCVCVCVCVCESVCAPGPGRFCPPLPPWLSGRTGNHREVQPAPPAGTSDLSYWTPASHTSACGANRRGGEGQRGGGWGSVYYVCVCVCVREGGVGRQREEDRWYSAKCQIVLQFLFCMFTFITDSKHTLAYWLIYIFVCRHTHTYQLLRTYRLEIHISTKTKKRENNVILQSSTTPRATETVLSVCSRDVFESWCISAAKQQKQNIQ